MFDMAFVVRTRKGWRRWRRSSAGLQDRYARVGVTDKGSVYNTDLMEAVELGFLLDCAETLVAAAAHAPRAGARTSARTTRSATTRTGSSTRWPTARRTERSGLEYKPVKMGPYIPMERKY